MLADLLAAFDDILNPQGHYCSGGQHKTAGGSDLADAYAARPLRPTN